MSNGLRAMVLCFLWYCASVGSYSVVFAQDIVIQPLAKMSRVLVVYYSRDGHTQQVAQALAKRFHADTERLIDMKKRTGPFGFPAAGKDAIAGNLTKLGPLAHDPGQYDVILIGTPSWFGNVTPAVRTFVKEYDLSQKKIGVFGTAHMTGVENALKELLSLIHI